MTWTQCKHGGTSPAEATLSADLTAARARIAELEDWQRRAVSWMLMQGADVKSPFVRAKLVGEAPA